MVKKTSFKKKNFQEKERTKWSSCKHVHGKEKRKKEKCTFLIMQYTNFNLTICTE